MKNTRSKIIAKQALPCGNIIEKKMVISTRPGIWKNTHQPVILPFSIHSAIYDGVLGDFKINAFVNTIKNMTNGKIAILMCEGAHINVLSLKTDHNLENTLKICRRDAEMLFKRFKDVFSKCEIVYWYDFINRYQFYDKCKQEIMKIISKNSSISTVLKNDVEKSYTETYAKIYPNKLIYASKAELDLIEMILSIKIMYERGYKILFYPGRMPDSVKHLQPYIYPEMLFVNVSIKRSKQDKNIL